MHTTPTGGSATTTSRPGRSAALDGLRGLALLGMMAWHAQLGWVKGGFARMTIFFVLAGFLSARSYLSISERQGASAFRTFWSRRARRLLPITALGIAVAVAVTVAIGTNRAQQSLSGDALSVIANVANWRFMVDDRSYGAMFENPSAFTHFWSLAVEEQWFLLLPVVLAVATWIGSRRAQSSSGAPSNARTRHVLAGIVVTLALVPLVVAHTPDQAYYGTHVRGAEFVAGMWLALWLRHHEQLGWQPRHRRIVAGAGTASLVLLVLVMLLVERDQAWLYRGGMALFAAPAAAVVAACIVGAPTLERVLGVAPLRWLGVAALSIYALHWPLFQVVEHALPDWPYAGLVTIQLAVAVGIGSAVHVLIERPLLARARTTRPRRTFTDRSVLVPAFALLAVVATFVVLWPVPKPTYDFEAAQSKAMAAADSETASAPAAPNATHLSVFGGSTALMLGLYTWTWTNPRDDVVEAGGYARLGCGVLTDGVRVAEAGAAEQLTPEDEEWSRPPVECRDWPDEWSRTVADDTIDVALILFGAWDTADWKIDGDDQWRTVGDEMIDALVVEQLEQSIDRLVDNGTRQVILATTPTVGPGATGRARAERSVPDDHDERIGRFNDLLRTVARERPAVALIEYGAAIDALDPAESARLMPDGVHPTDDTAREIWSDHLGPMIEGLIAR